MTGYREDEVIGRSLDGMLVARCGVSPLLSTVQPEPERNPGTVAMWQAIPGLFDALSVNAYGHFISPLSTLALSSRLLASSRSGYLAFIASISA